jgi:hypothetical protein
VSVASASGIPSGSVSIADTSVTPSVQLASGTLIPSSTANTSQATFIFALENGTHTLSATYAGNSGFQSSTSQTPASVPISTQCTSKFVVTLVNVTPATASSTNGMTLTPGQTGTATVNVIPTQAFVSSLSAPAFITISCSGLSDLANCNFTPENVEILSTQNAAVTSTMVLQTYAADTTSALPGSRQSNPVSWAFLLPGVLGLGGLAFGARRKQWLSRLSLIALLGMITLLSTTACNPRYGYLKHKPDSNLPTPAGTYTVVVTAQYSNDVTSVEQSTSITLTVN